jgi:ribose transport system substrate-binding protein
MKHPRIEFSGRGRLVLVPVLMLALALFVTACGESSSSTSSGGSVSTSEGSGGEAGGAKGAKIALLNQVANDYNKALTRGANQAAEKAGASISEFAAEFDASKQYQQCQDAVASGEYQGLILYAVDAGSISACAKQAISEGMKVVALEGPIGPNFNEMSPQVEGVLGSVFWPADKDAEVQFGEVEKACKGHTPCQVADIVGTLSASYDSTKLTKIKELVSEEPNIELVAVGESDYELPKALAAAQDILQAHPDVNVIFGNSDEIAEGAEQAAEQAGMTGIVFIGEGASLEGKTQIEEGKMFSSAPVYVPIQSASAATEMIIKSLNGEPLGKTEITGGELSSIGDVLNASNAKKFEPQWSHSE